MTDESTPPDMATTTRVSDGFLDIETVQIEAIGHARYYKLRTPSPPRRDRLKWAICSRAVGKNCRVSADPAVPRATSELFNILK